MDFVLLFGPPAVGKMTIGHELSRLTGLPLFHNHVSIEAVATVFKHGSPAFNRLNAEMRRRVFEEAAAGRARGPGLIFTFVWDLDAASDKAFVDEACAIFAGARIALVELYADQETRLARNRTEFRLLHKPSKRDLEWSDGDLRRSDAGHRLNSDGDFFYPDRHLRVDTAGLTAAESARRIHSHFGLPSTLD